MKTQIFVIVNFYKISFNRVRINQIVVYSFLLNPKNIKYVMILWGHAMGYWLGAKVET